MWRNRPTRTQAASLLKFLDHTIRRTHPVGILWTSDQLVAEGATYTTYNKHVGRTSVLVAGFEPAIPEIERQHTYALDRTATGIGEVCHFLKYDLVC